MKNQQHFLEDWSITPFSPSFPRAKQNEANEKCYSIWIIIKLVNDKLHTADLLPAQPKAIRW